MVRAMGALERGGCTSPAGELDDGVTYAAKIEKAEARIDWNKSAHAVLRHIHGLSPFPGAWCEMVIEGETARVKILRCELATGSGSRASCSTIVARSRAGTARSEFANCSAPAGPMKAERVSAWRAAKTSDAAEPDAPLQTHHRI